jgi:hypothetical protein
MAIRGMLGLIVATLLMSTTCVLSQTDTTGGVPGQASSASSSVTRGAAHVVAPKVTPAAGASLVWVNTSSKIYHCTGDKWYGKTKHGEYMAKSEAAAKGYKPTHGKDCL